MLNLKSGHSISNTDEVDGLHTSATDVDQSSNGHSHTLPSQDKSKQSHKYCLKRKKKRTVINLIVYDLKESQESYPCKGKGSDIKETKEHFQKHLY